MRREMPVKIYCNLCTKNIQDLSDNDEYKAIGGIEEFYSKPLRFYNYGEGIEQADYIICIKCFDALKELINL
jgi:hypothetical protein